MLMLMLSWQRLLVRAGWTPEDLGDRLNRSAAAMGLRAHIHRKSVRRWVRDMPSCPIIARPSEPWPALVCQLLGQQTGETVTPAVLGWPRARVVCRGGRRSRSGPTVDPRRGTRRLGPGDGCWTNELSTPALLRAHRLVVDRCCSPVVA